MALVNAKIDDDIRIEFPERAHSFPAKFAVALVESLKWAIGQEEDFEVFMAENPKGNPRWCASAGNASGQGSNAFEAVVDFWQLHVSYRFMRR